MKEAINDIVSGRSKDRKDEINLMELCLVCDESFDNIYLITQKRDKTSGRIERLRK